MLKTLVVSGGGFQGTTLIRCLSMCPKIQIHMADCYIENINKYNVDYWHVIAPVSNNQKFILDIESIIKKHQIDILFPATDHELDLLSKNKDSIEELGAKLALSHHNILSKLRSKIEAHAFCEKHYLPVLAKVNLPPPLLQYPLIGKPDTGFGGKGIFVVRNYEELKEVQSKIEKQEYLWQNYLKDIEEYSIDFAIGFDNNISPIIVRKRVKTSGGFAVIAQSENDKYINKIIAKFASILKNAGGCGVFNVQVLKTTEGKYYISDINPRVGTSSIFSLGTGINLPLFMCTHFDKSINYTIKGISSPKKIKMVRNISEHWITMISTNTIKGVVFDLDDTLINQKQWIFDKLNLMHDHLHHKLPDKGTFLSTALHFLEEGKRGTLIDEIAKRFSIKEYLRDQMIEIYRNVIPDAIFVYNDVINTLKRLKKNNLKLCLLTDNPPNSQKQKINKLEFTHLFDGIILTQELNTEKPDKKLFWEAASRLALRPESLAMVGDNLYRDIYGAINADYSVGFFIERKGSFFNFDYDLFTRITDLKTDSIIKIQSLNELFFSLCDMQVQYLGC